MDNAMINMVAQYVCVSGLTVAEVFPIMGFRGVTQAVLLPQQGVILR